jgi:ribosome-binding protein aMBF1 (putative translation factor)
MIKNCELCNEEIEVSRSTVKYCEICRKIKTKEINKKYRDKNKEKRNKQYNEWKEKKRKFLKG